MKPSLLALALLLLGSLAVAAMALPDMKPGMWQTAEAYVKKNCSKDETRHEGSKWVTDMVCKLDPTTQMITHSETTFAGDSAYHTEMTIHYEPAKAARPRDRTVVDG